MILPSQFPPRQREIAEGVFQSTIGFDPQALTPDDFAREGIVLPLNLQGAVKKRQIEYLAGRYCARICFRHFGVHPAPDIASHEDRSPVWPAGWVGSISHGHGLATALLARTTTLRGIGADIEQVIAKASANLASHICADASELPRVAQQLGLAEDLALTLIFSGKESLYKAVYPRLKVFFGFHAAEVFLNADNGLSIRLVTDLSDEFPRGREWDLQYRILEQGFVETMILDWK